MSQSNPSGRSTKVVEFLETLGSNPERKLEEVAKDCSVSRTSAYHYINEFVKDVIMIDSDPDFPRRVLAAYNKESPAGSDKLNAVDVEQLSSEYPTPVNSPTISLEPTIC